ncbi:MAG: hypothetical protein AAAB35_16655 [Phyllobacterium sp.]|uniref:hypothetical protein n=1 Tax=Phyllobacterium sp. TaxID=1871046 RepID=UPI0030F171BE
MNRFATILALVTALCIGWVPVFAAPARLAAEIETPHVGGKSAAQHMHQRSECAGQHCAKNSAPHPALCAACIGVPAMVITVLIGTKPKIIIPRGRELPLVTRIPAPLPRPPTL